MCLHLPSSENCSAKGIQGSDHLLPRTNSVGVHLPHALHHGAEFRAKASDSTALSPDSVTFDDRTVDLFFVLIRFPA